MERHALTHEEVDAHPVIYDDGTFDVLNAATHDENTVAAIVVNLRPDPIENERDEWDFG